MSRSVSDSPAWRALQLLLDEIRGVTGAQNALVFDSSCRMWCAALAYFTMDPTLAAETVAGALAGLDTPLHRGGVLDGPTPRHLGFGYARAFANVYVLLLRFSGPFEVTLVRDTTEPFLPRLEALTLALPPPEDPGGADGEGLMQA